EKPRENKIQFHPDVIRKRLGKPDLKNDTILNILQKLGIQVQEKGDDWIAQIPSYRSYYDLTIPEDIVEEVGRMIGYAEIQPTPISVLCEVPQYKNKLRDLEHSLRRLLAYAYGFLETYQYAFVSKEDVEADTRFSQTAIRLANPISEDTPYLRISPVPALLKSAAENYKAVSSLKIFEIERIFIPKNLNKPDEESLPDEKNFLAALWLLSTEESKNQDAIKQALQKLRSYAADIFIRLGQDENELIYENIQSGIFHPGRAGIVSTSSRQVSIDYGQLHPALAERYGIERPVLYLECFLDDLLSLSPTAKYKRLNPFPPADFEVTILADKKLPFSKMKETIQNISWPKGIYLENITYLKEYDGKPIPEGKKSVSIRIEWRKEDGTISSKELKKMQDNVVANLAQKGFPLKSE
ncbi:MAG: hypothetical protein D6767_01045, partial [Candidatus Hydrogenedentota bacterium]